MAQQGRSPVSRGARQAVKQVLRRYGEVTSGLRSSPDFVIVARTDSRAVAGFDEAVARANLALAAGADMAFVEAPQTVEELAAVPKRVAGPCLINVVWRGKTPDISFDDAQRMGYRLAIVPAAGLGAYGPGSHQAATAKRRAWRPARQRTRAGRRPARRLGHLRA